MRQIIGKYLAVAALLALVCLEGYYIVLLRDTVRRQAEDLRDISVRLQNLRSERDILYEEISVARKQAEEGNHGNTINRQR